LYSSRVASIQATASTTIARDFKTRRKGPGSDFNFDKVQSWSNIVCDYSACYFANNDNLAAPNKAVIEPGGSAFRPRGLRSAKHDLPTQMAMFFADRCQGGL
jgi:hypothetical protein